MFSLEETLTWTADDVFERLRTRGVLPPGWTVKRTVEGGWHRVVLLDAEGGQQWLGENADPKLVGLDALGWLRVRQHQVKQPVWRPRESEVPLHRPPDPLVSAAPDPPDVDPDEVAAVYKPSR